MDIRVKTFVREATRQLDFLTGQHGFAGPEVDNGPSPGTAVSIWYRRGQLTIEASLALWYMGEEHVAITQVSDGPDGTTQRTEVARNTAHTGYQMRRALNLQAEAIRSALRRD